MRVFFALLFIFSLSSLSFGQADVSYTLEGTVREASSGYELPGATIAVYNEDGEMVAQGTTNMDGSFRLPKLSGGLKKVEVSYIGYESSSRLLNLAEDDLRALVFELEMKTSEMNAIEIIGSSPNINKKIPGTVTQLRTESVQSISPTGTQELLQYVPGVIGFADDGTGKSRISVGIRGLNPRRTSKTLVLEDGVPIQPAIYIYPNMYYNPPAERIDELEIIKSSASIQYGPQTMGGVINYITKRPRNEFGGEVVTTGGTNAYAGVFAEVGGFSNSDKVKPALQLLYKRGDGFRENNDFEQLNGTFKLNLLPQKEKVLYVKGNVNREITNATYTGLTPYSFNNDPDFNPKEHDIFKKFRSSLDLIYTNRINERLIAKTTAYANYFHRDWWREDDVFVKASEYDGPNSDINPVPYYETGDLLRVGNGETNTGILRDFYVVGVRHNYEFKHELFGQTSTLTAGGRLHWEKFIDERKKGFAPDARDGVFYTGNPDNPDSLDIVGQSHHYETRAFSAFAQDKINYGNLTLRPGIRFEAFEQSRIDRLVGSQYIDKTNLVLLPGFGINYQIDSFNLFAGIHRGYTPPSSGAVKIASLRDDVEDGGLDVKPEKSWNKELGIRGQTDFYNVELTGFHLSVTDMVAAGVGTAFKNVGKVDTYGLEMMGKLAVSRKVSWLPDVHVTYTFLQTDIQEGEIRSALKAGATVDVSGNELPYAPEHSLIAGISREFDFGLSMRLDYRFVDQVYTDYENIGFNNPNVNYNRGDTGPVPSYWLLNGSVTYRFSSNWEAQLVGKNITDEVYIGSRLHSNPRQRQADLSTGIMPGPRRQVNLKIRYTF